MTNPKKDSLVPTFEQMMAVNNARDQKYGNTDPFRRTTRLAEETGELAGEVNHFENQGVKKKKHGKPDKKHLAKEVFDVMAGALSLAQHYNCVDEVRKIVRTTFQNYRKDGFIDSGKSEKKIT